MTVVRSISYTEYFKLSVRLEKKIGKLLKRYDSKRKKNVAFIDSKDFCFG